MSIHEMKFIGRVRTMKFGMIGFALGYLLVAAFGGILWIFEVSFGGEVLAGLFAFIILIYWLGGVMGVLILKRNWNAGVTALIGTIVIVELSASVGSLVGLLGNEVLFGWMEHIRSYLIKPVIGIFFWGGIPMLVLGILLGISIEKRKMI